jgi:hypothetical protein
MFGVYKTSQSWHPMRGKEKEEEEERKEQQ